MPSKIEWTEETWNPITGCTKISEGCKHCYAERMAQRLAGRYGYPKDDPFRPGTWHEDKLEEPLRRKKPTTYFVSSMGDLFHDNVPPDCILHVWGVMRAAKRHTFIILTKRPENMYYAIHDLISECEICPLPNVWLGVTAENQARADERIPWLLRTPAAVRFVSVEPMLGAVELAPYFPQYDHRPSHEYYHAIHGGNGQSILLQPGLDWVICGGETGPGARPMHPEWARSLRDQCQDAGVPFFFKSWGEWATLSDVPTGMVGYWHARAGNLHYFPDNTMMCRFGKNRAGRLLDGRTWDEMPAVHHG